MVTKRAKVCDTKLEQIRVCFRSFDNYGYITKLKISETILEVNCERTKGRKVGIPKCTERWDKNGQKAVLGKCKECIQRGCDRCVA